MADKRFRGRDKIVQKMTKDGLVEENLRTGETKSAVAEEPPKQEDSEKAAAESAEETPVGLGRPRCPHGQGAFPV